MRQIASARNCLNSPGNEGIVNSKAPGLRQGDNRPGPRKDDIREQPQVGDEAQGDGVGRGRGKGSQPENTANGNFYDSSVKQNVTQGAGIATDMVEGPNLKGHALAEIQKESTAVQQGTTDPLSGQRLPKQHSKFAREYFDSVRDEK
jgi:hypothetical protein